MFGLLILSNAHLQIPSSQDIAKATSTKNMLPRRRMNHGLRNCVLLRPCFLKTSFQQFRLSSGGEKATKLASLLKSILTQEHIQDGNSPHIYSPRPLSHASRGQEKYSPVKKSASKSLANRPNRPFTGASDANLSRVDELSRKISSFNPNNLKKKGKKTLSKTTLKKHNAGPVALFKKPRNLMVSNLELNESTKCLEAIANVDETRFAQAKKPVAEEIPRLAHGLDKVLFSPGVHFLQDPRTKIFNFTRYLEKIRPYKEFDSSKFPGFVSASKDCSLLNEAITQNKTYYSSTSSMTLTLIQFYLLLNNYTAHATSDHRFNFPPFTRNATELPLCLIVEPKGINNDGNTVFSVTSDKSTDVEILLLALGHCLEALLTTEENEFAHYLVKSPNQESESVETESSSEPLESKDLIENPDKPAANIYNYSSYKGFLMRSQLDCYDFRLPGNGTFDLKTRAACAIRYDQHPDSAKTNYRISKLNGNIESFEREYKDLIKTAGLLKYGFQARIGQMDGIFIAYHSVNSFSGFQYLPLSEIDKVFYSDQNVEYQREKFGTPQEIIANDNIASYVAENQFKVSLTIWEDIMKLVAKDFKGTQFENMPYRLIFKRMTCTKRTRGKIQATPESFMRVFAVPLTKENMKKIQDFPSQFKTSFREDLTQDERLENLTKAEKQLNQISREVVDNVPIFCYRISTSYHVKGSNISAQGKHPYPRKINQGHEWHYTIEKELDNLSEGVIKDNYLKLMEIAAAVMTMGGKMASAKKKVSEITQIVRKYGEVGRLREEQLKLLDSKPSEHNSANE